MECCSCVGLCEVPPTPAYAALAAQPVKAPISDAEMVALVSAKAKVHPAHMPSFNRRLSALHRNSTRATGCAAKRK